MSTPLDFVNLTNGFDCPHFPSLTAYGFTRIQSTHCEQKRWDLVIYGAGPQLLSLLALGAETHIHDQSEKERETRACWQGLPLIRRACEMTWRLPITPLPPRHRGGIALDRYLTEQVRLLPDSVLAFVRYYRRFNPTGVKLYSCYNSVKTTADANDDPYLSVVR